MRSAATSAVAARRARAACSPSSCRRNDMPARILIVEDNTANLELVRYLLESAGYRTLSAMDGVEGLAMARREKPDLVLCDLQLPQLDGYGVLQGLRES